MSEKTNLVPKNGTHSSPPQKGSMEIKNVQVNRSRPAFKPLPVLEQVKIVTRLIEYLETR